MNKKFRKMSIKEDIIEELTEGCGKNMGSYGVHGYLICGKDNYSCPNCKNG